MCEVCCVHILPGKSFEGTVIDIKPDFKLLIQTTRAVIKNGHFLSKLPQDKILNQAQPRTRNAQAPKVWPETPRGPRSRQVSFTWISIPSCIAVAVSAQSCHIVQGTGGMMATVSLQGVKMGYDTLSGEKKITVALRGQMDCSLRKTKQIFFKMLKRCTKHNKSWIKYNRNSWMCFCRMFLFTGVSEVAMYLYFQGHRRK